MAKNRPVWLWTVVPLLLGGIAAKLVWGSRQEAARAELEEGTAAAEAALEGTSAASAPSEPFSGPVPPSYNTLPASQIPPVLQDWGGAGNYNFSWEEFERSAKAEREGIDNTLVLGQKRNILWGVEWILQKIRDGVARAVTITGGARSAALNTALGGAVSSQHMVGQAVDISVNGYSAKQLFDFILTLGLPFDQLIWYDEIVGSANRPKSAGHVHISWNPNRSGGPRGMTLHAMQGQTKTEYEVA